MAQHHHHRLYLRPQRPVSLHHHHYDLIPWHPHKARASSPNNPAMRRGPAFSGFDVPLVPEPASPSSIYTRPPAFQTSQSRCSSRRPGVFRQCIPRHRPPCRPVSVKPRNPSHGRLQPNPAAHLSTRLLARRCLTCTGKRRKLTLAPFCYSDRD